MSKGMNITGIDFSEYEAVDDPVPSGTPREIAQWAHPGKDFEELKNPMTGQDWTWEELREAGMDQIMAQQLARLMQLSTKPITLRKKTH